MDLTEFLSLSLCLSPSPPLVRMGISEYVAFPDMLPVCDEFFRKRALSCIVFALHHVSLFLSFFFFYIVIYVFA